MSAIEQEGVRPTSSVSKINCAERLRATPGMVLPCENCWQTSRPKRLQRGRFPMPTASGKLCSTVLSSMTCIMRG